MLSPGSLVCVLAFCSIVISTPLNQPLSLSDMPACALECSATALSHINCFGQNFTTCFCSLDNTALRVSISACTMANCSATDQSVASAISQEILCAGYPQPSRAEEEIRTTAIITAVAMIFVSLRLLARIVTTGKLRWDDYLIVFTAGIMIANTVIQTVMCKHGFGKHFYDVSPKEIPFLLKMLYSSQIIYVFNQNLPKFSILILYLQIFTNPNFVLIVKLAMLWMGAHTLSFLVAVILQCTPVAKFWYAATPGKCMNEEALIYFGAGFSIAEDLVIMLLPVIELRGLNLRWMKRFELMVMFAIGSFACVTSIVRLKYISQYGKTIDVTWDNVDVVVWSEIETYTAVICSCLIPIRPLIIKWIPARIFGSTSSKKNTGPSTHSFGNGNGNKRNQRSWGYTDNDGDQSPLHQSRRSSSAVEVTTGSAAGYELERQDSDSKSPISPDTTTSAPVEIQYSFPNGR